MFDPQEEHSYDCPHCGTPLTLVIDSSAGERQSFTVDCEICCHPIAIRLELGADGVSEFSATRE